MISSAFVHLWGNEVGAVIWDEDQGYARFEYSPTFMDKGWDIAPIHMPTRAGRTRYTFPQLRAERDSPYDTFKGLPGLLADSLPDRYGNRLMDVWLAQQGRPAGSMNPVEQLCFIGQRGMGALEFEPSRIADGKQSQALELAGLIDMAARLLNERGQFHTSLTGHEQEAMMKILKIGTSAGGARPKALIAYNDQTREVRSGQTDAPAGFAHWLLKLDGVHDAQFGTSRGYGRVEMAYYLMAKECGIDIMESRLLKENGRAHFMTKRFDREGHDTKHHIQTFCAIRHFDYNQVGAYSYEQLFETMRMLRLPYPEAQELYRRMVFNVILRNCDDHTKNFAFILKRGERWKLAPAYDLCHAYRPDSIWVSQHALSIRGKRQDHSRADLLAIAKDMNIKEAEAIIEQTLEVASRWSSFAEEVAVEEALKKRIESSFVKL
jgi:serine/threonine-protein kinase HipA